MHSLKDAGAATALMPHHHHHNALLPTGGLLPTPNAAILAPPPNAFSNATVKDETLKANPASYLYSSNPIDNPALIDPQHQRDLHNALVASINNNVAAVNGTLSIIKREPQSQPQNNSATQVVATTNAVLNGTANNTQSQQVATNATVQQAAMALLNGSANGTLNTVNNGSSGAKSSSSGRSTPSNSGGSGTDPAPGKLFVGGLSWQTSAEKLKEYFNVFGTVTDVLIMKDPVTQRSRGFGFITFQEPCSVDKVLKVPIHTLDGKKIDPKHATPKNRPRQTNKTKKIFVGGVSQDTSADEVKAYFSQFGTVEETVMLMDQQTKRHRGFGFVTFENEDVVDRVCEIHFHTIKNKKVECKKAQPKEAVTPAAQLLQKRLMLGTLGVPMPSASQLLGATATTTRTPGVTSVSHLAMLQAPATQLQLAAGGAAAAAAAQQAALLSQNPFQVQNAAAAASALAANQAGFGKLLTYPAAALHSVRYSPYSIPAGAAAAANALAQAQQQQAQQHHAAAVAQQQQNAASAAAQRSAAAMAANSATHNAHNALVAVAGPQGANTAPNGAGGATAQTASTHPFSAAAAAQQAALVAANPLNGAANPYQNYALTNVDMSAFQNVDWSSMYGMGMYV